MRAVRAAVAKATGAIGLFGAEGSSRRSGGIVRLGPLLEEQGDEFSAELDTVQILLYRLIQGEAPLVSNIL